MAESKSSRTVEARKRPRKPKGLQADRSPLLAVQASRVDDPHSASVQDRAQANPTVGRFQTGKILLFTSAQTHPAHWGQFWTVAAFIDLTTAYDTINHRRLLAKLVMLTDNVPLTKFIRTMLPNRRFKVEANRVHGEISESASHKAQCYPFCCSTCTPTTNHAQFPPTVSSTPTTCALPPNSRRSNRWRLTAPAE